MIIASFDIGKKNFSFCVEYTQETKRDVLMNKYRRDGTIHEKFKNRVKETLNNGRLILLSNIDLTSNCVETKKFDPEVYFNMIDELDTHKDIWDLCDVFLIEKQMMFGKHTNPTAVKLGQHCYSYFCLNYGRFKSIIEFPAYHKTQVLGAEKKLIKGKYKHMSKPERKKWCISKALEILNDRIDDVSYREFILSSKKKDDLCDVICQLQAYKIMTYL